jgi:hypothetical protein
MNAMRFDAVVRALHSGRGALRLATGLGAALVTVKPAMAAACLPTRSTCDPDHPEQCCTLACTKRKGKFTCAPVGQAFGCTKKVDACRTGEGTRCPDNVDATFCIAGKKGKPLCAAIPGNCAACASDADCVDLLGEPTARCIKGCPGCRSAGFNTNCVVPAGPPP